MSNHEALPDWIPAEAWAGYVEMRKAIKKPLKTDRAINLAINTLERLRADGNDPGAVLDQSTLHGWQGLFDADWPMWCFAWFLFGTTVHTGSKE